MGMLIAPVEVRDLKVDYIYKLWGSLAPDSPWRSRGALVEDPSLGQGGTGNLAFGRGEKKTPALEGVGFSGNPNLLRPCPYWLGDPDKGGA